MSKLPLSGITVLELGSSIAGPFAGVVLADLGAEVLKVEQPVHGDPARGWGDERLGGTGVTYQAYNKDKRSIVADFTDPADLEQLRRLMAERVDVVLQNLRPGVVERFGLDAATAMAANPRLIYCNLAAFGAKGPLKDLPGYDPLIQAFSGIIDATGEPGRDPVRVGVPLIDIGTGMWATIGILAAIRRRDNEDRGCLVDAAMFDTALAWQSLSFAILEGGGTPPRRTGLKGAVLVPNTGYDTADGKLLITIGTEKQFRRFCQALGRPEIADDPRFATNNARIDNVEAFGETISDILRRQPRAHWSEQLNAVDVPNAPLLSLAEVIGHEQTAASEMLQTSPDGTFRLIGLPLRFDGERPPFRRASPELGEATQEVFAFMADDGRLQSA